MMDLLIRGLRRLHLLKHAVLRPRRFVCGRSFRIPVYLDKGTTHLEDREPWLDPLLQVLLLRSQGAFVEAGTNVGGTLLRAHVIAPASQYLGFEPNPACVAYVEELMRENRITGPRVMAVALGDYDGSGVLQFHHADPADRTATLIPEYDQGQQIDRVVAVPVVRFDDVAVNLLKKEVGVVRLDTNGGDLEVLRGMQDTIARHRPAIILHLPPVYRPTNTERLRRQELIEGELGKHGYALYRVHEDGYSIHVEPIHGPIGIHGELDWSNYIAIHRDRTAGVLSAFHVVEGPQRYDPVLR